MKHHLTFRLMNIYRRRSPQHRAPPHHRTVTRFDASARLLDFSNFRHDNAIQEGGRAAARHWEFE